VAGEKLDFVIYMRRGCHLCEVMYERLLLLIEVTGWEAEVELVDIDQDPALRERYGELVPVLELNGEELCHFRLDEERVKRAVEALRPG